MHIHVATLWLALYYVSFVSFLSLFRKLTDQQRELITQFAQTENLSNGTVDGIDQGQCDQCALSDRLMGSGG